MNVRDAGPGNRSRSRVWLAWIAVVLAGCGDVPRTFPVEGKLLFEKGDVALLAGSSLICQRQEEPYYQAEGDIQDDGSFKLSTRVKGSVLEGAVEGSYRAWIVFSSENGSEERQFRKIGIDPRVLNGQTSELFFRVPVADTVVLTVKHAPPGARLIAPPEDTVRSMGVPCGGEPDEPDTSAPTPD